MSLGNPRALQRKQTTNATFSKMAAKEEVNVSQLFLEVSKKFKDGEYAVAQKSTNKSKKTLLFSLKYSIQLTEPFYWKIRSYFLHSHAAATHKTQYSVS